MNMDKIINNLPVEIGLEKRKLMGIWLTDLNKGFSLEVEGDSVKGFHHYRENVNYAIELNHWTWEKVISSELSMYDAIITGKVNFIGNQWEVIKFFDHLNLKGF